eukprot:COSAG05_NODE_22229_length_266_cov_0.622754_2_plen_55_part_01
MGGFDGSGAVTHVEAFCPMQGTWTRLRSMLTARTGFAACTVMDGLVVVAGGFNES